MMKLNVFTIFLALLLMSCSGNVADQNDKSTADKDSIAVSELGERWSKEKANDYWTKWGWLRGANFQPSSAINQIEMWQEDTFDPETIDKELGWAADIGFNSMRVYLHHIVWENDKEGFKSRMEKYLNIAYKRGISTIFVFFDDCWNPTYTAGKQPEPQIGIHNSGWVRDPGDVEVSDSLLEEYVKDVMNHFADDKRIVFWDLYNEPGNSGYGNESMPLLEKVFAWGRDVNPSQPLSVGVWNMDLKELNEYQLAHSDIVSYHNYMDPETHQQWIDSLQTYGRPMICTEYMARTRNSTFQNTMPMLKANNIGAINWGLVSGKTNTKYQWDTPMKDGGEPKLWFHEVFHTDGKPYSQEEVNTIKKLTGKSK